MTNYIVSGDIHLQIKKDVPLEWQINRYRTLWAKYVDLCEEHHASLILSGDLFENHKITSLEMQLFMELCELLDSNSIRTYIISGNHDYSDPKNPTLKHFEPFFKTLNYVQYNSSEEIYLPGDKVDLYLVGHPALKSYEKPQPRSKRKNVMISHFRPTVNEFIREELDVKKFMEGFDLCVASDIHMPIELYGNKLVFTNHPCNSSYEYNPSCGCILLNLGDEILWSRLLLSVPNLRLKQLTAEEYDNSLVIVNSTHFTKIEITGTPEELRQLELYHEGAQAKIVKIPVVEDTYAATEEAEEAEVKDIAVEEALLLYMQELKIEEERIAQLMAVFREA